MNKKNVLIIVDMQNDFVTGSLGTRDAKKIIPNVKNKIDKYMNDKDGIIIFTRDTHSRRNYLDTQEGKKLPIEHCIYGTKGWEIVPELDVKYKTGKVFVFDKSSFGFDSWKSELDYHLLNSRNINKIDICGVCTDICVVSNALILKAIFRDIEITVDASCCAGSSVDAHFAALQVMENCQVNIVG